MKGSRKRYESLSSTESRGVKNKCPGGLGTAPSKDIQLVVWHIIVVALHVFDGAMITLFEAFPECSAVMFIDRRMLVDVVVIGISVTTVRNIVPGSFDTFMETAALGILVRVGRTIPVAILILILRCCGQGLSRRCIRLECAWGGDAEGKQRRGNPFYLHRNIYLRVTP